MPRPCPQGLPLTRGQPPEFTGSGEVAPRERPVSPGTQPCVRPGELCSVWRLNPQTMRTRGGEGPAEKPRDRRPRPLEGTASLRGSASSPRSGLSLGSRAPGLRLHQLPSPPSPRGQARPPSGLGSLRLPRDLPRPQPCGLLLAGAVRAPGALGLGACAAFLHGRAEFLGLQGGVPPAPGAGGRPGRAGQGELRGGEGEAVAPRERLWAEVRSTRLHPPRGSWCCDRKGVPIRQGSWISHKEEFGLGRTVK